AGFESSPSTCSWFPADRQNMGWALSPARWVWHAQLCSEVHRAQTPATSPRVPAALAPRGRAARLSFLPSRKVI
ncbi:SHANK2 isoform 7, partial [Pan troglodytes]